MTPDEEREAWSVALLAGAMLRRRLSWDDPKKWIDAIPRDVEDLRPAYHYIDETVPVWRHKDARSR